MTILQRRAPHIYDFQRRKRAIVGFRGDTIVSASAKAAQGLSKERGEGTRRAGHPPGVPQTASVIRSPFSRRPVVIICFVFCSVY